MCLLNVPFSMSGTLDTQYIKWAWPQRPTPSNCLRTCYWTAILFYLTSSTFDILHQHTSSCCLAVYGGPLNVPYFICIDLWATNVVEDCGRQTLAGRLKRARICVWCYQLPQPSRPTPDTLQQDIALLCKGPIKAIRIYNGLNWGSVQREHYASVISVWWELWKLGVCVCVCSHMRIDWMTNAYLLSPFLQKMARTATHNSLRRLNIIQSQDGWRSREQD